MKKIVKNILLYFIVFLAALALMTAFLTVSALISTDSVRENFKESADYLCEDIVFPYFEEEIHPSCIDRYADAILLNIAFNFDPDSPLKSVMWSSYYYSMRQHENENLKSTVYDGAEKNKQYLRYWHGSAGVVRILHTFMNLKQIYILHGVLLSALFGILIFLLIRFRCVAEAVIFAISLVAVSVWYVPFSMEYTWVFICMFVFSIITILVVRKGRESHLGILFLISGMVTNFLDFLTTETLTLTIPLLLVLVLKRRFSGDNFTEAKSGNPWSLKQGLKFAAPKAVSWGIGYIGMWVSKWILASIVLGQNVMPMVSEHIEERLDGEIGASSIFEYLWLAISKNIKCLFPIDHGLTGVIISGLLILVIAYVCYVYKRKKIEWGHILMFLIIGALPIVRFLILHNHSTIHYFFTFRALAATVFALLLSCRNMVEFGLVRKKKSKSSKNK